jgi:hypothetical protein
VPQAVIDLPLFDHFDGADKQSGRHTDDRAPSRSRGWEQLNFRGLSLVTGSAGVVVAAIYSYMDEAEN